MRTLIALSISITALLGAVQPVRALTPAHLWSQRFGGPGTDVGYSVAVDASGNVFATGYFNGTVNFGGSNLVSAGGADIFVAKYNAAGVHQWSQRFGSTLADFGYSVAVDDSGNVLTTGYFNGTVNFGSGNMVSAGVRDIFVAKYGADGVNEWSLRLGSTSDDEGKSVAVDASGNVFATGYFNGTVNFGGGNLVSAGVQDVFIAKYNYAGVHQWSQRFGSTSFDQGRSLALDASGNVFATGTFRVTVNFGGGNLVSAGVDDMFLAKYNAAGVHQWSQRFGSTSFDQGSSVAVDASGNVFATGFFGQTVNFGGSPLVSAGNDDIFVAKYNAAGAHQWSQRFGSTDADRGNSVAVEASGNVSATGNFVGTVNFGGGNLVGAGVEDIFVARYNAAGVHQWSQRFGSTGNNAVGNSVAVAPSGDVFATGLYSGSVDFGGGNLVSAGGTDIFVAKYAREAAEPVISTITDVGNDQGRRVRIAFTRSGHDDEIASTPVVRYEAYLRDSPTPFAVVSPIAARDPGHVLADGWVEVASISAHAEPTYLIDAPTDADSTVALGQYHSAFYIRAATTAPAVFFDSPIDSGYSLDNLAPGVPENLVFETGDLTWAESNAADFDFFTVYGSNTNSFGAAVVVDYSVAPAMDVSGSPYDYYFVTATDFSGNEGKPAVVHTLSGVGGTPKSYVLSVSNYPNPFNPRTTVSYTVPSRGRVSVRVFDTRGAHVATLFDGERDAGAYTVDWSGRADNGDAVASGLYFARIEHASGTRSKKLVMIK